LVAPPNSVNRSTILAAAGAILHWRRATVCTVVGRLMERESLHSEREREGERFSDLLCYCATILLLLC
jgi:predicted transcriptional regulator